MTLSFMQIMVRDIFFKINSQGVGIGTTNITGSADANNDYILNAGIVTARKYYGDGIDVNRSY